MRGLRSSSFQAHVLTTALAFLGVAGVSAQAAPFNAVSSGVWSATTTWGGPIPGNGDTVTITNPITVTVTDDRTVGTSGSSGTVAIALGTRGALLIADGGTLRVRGDVVYTAGQGITLPAVTVAGGGRWHWDASQASSPTNTHYTFRPLGEFGFRPFVLTGTASKVAVADSEAGSGAGQFTLVGTSIGGPFAASHGYLDRIGDASHPGWSIGWYSSQGTNLTWDVQDTVFTNCGAIQIIGGTIHADAIFRHNRNRHTATKGSTVFTAFAGSGATGNGAREIIGSVFDAPAAGSTYAQGFTLRGNYFGGGLNILWQSDSWALCEDNFYRVPDQWTWVSGNRLADSVVFLDRDWDNPHVIFGTSLYQTQLDGLILSHAGSTFTDSGEWVFSLPGSTHCIFLPNQYGYSSCEMLAASGGAAGPYSFEHNTWFGGYAPKANNTPGSPGFAAFQYSESGNSLPGAVKSFRSNIMWNPGTASRFCKMNDVHSMSGDQAGGPPTQDFGNPTNIDYNTGWNYTPDNEIAFANQAHYTNWGKGYIGNWSQTPGAHDRDVDPGFVDYQRDIQLFATRCLGRSPTRGTWQASPATPYAVGDTVLNTTTILWGLPVLYRYIGTGANPQPGGGTRTSGDANAWRSSWEWASLHIIREDILAGTLYAGEDVVTHLIKWIRAGYAPTNPALRGAAHDGGDIGAVPYSGKPGLRLSVAAHPPSEPLAAVRQERSR